MKGKRKVTACIMLALLLASQTVIVQATEETRKKINQAEQEKKDTESKLNETEENLDQLNEQKNSLQGA